MNGIAFPPDSSLGAPPGLPALALWREALARVREHLDVCKAHPARSVVLLPFAQLLPVAQSQWAALYPDGFAPHFETTHTWAQRLACFTPGPYDISFSAARDALTARDLLESARMALPRDAARDAFTPLLVQAALQVAPLAAAVPSRQRADWGRWAAEAVPAPSDGWLAHENALMRLALRWAAASDYATDVLFAARTLEQTDALIAFHGAQTDELTGSLIDFFTPEKSISLPLPAPPAPEASSAAERIRLHPAPDAESEARRAAACVLAHLAAGRAPVALASSDRALMRRVRALLGERLNVRDETGWKLSTTQSAAILMAALHACARQASSDDVLAWLKLAPAASAWPARAVPELEAYLRRHAVSQWPQSLPEDAPPHLEQALQAIHAARAACQAPRALPAWLTALRALLQAAGQWEPLAQDAAGARVLETLLLTDTAALHELPAARQRLSLPAFTAWAADALEAASFIPPAAPQPDLILLPLAQVMGRPLAALVLPGCDENHLPLAPEPPGLWTPPQRAHLRLPTQAAQQAAQQTAWQHALAVPYVDLLWRQGDERGQPLLASPLVRHLALQLGLNETADDPCSTRAIDPAPTPRPAPQGSALPVATLSASAYGDLRACPYRFFALRQLNLKEAPELDAGPDKRDFGNWLHATLHHFHERLKADPKADRPARAAWLDEAAQAVTQEKALSESDFLPFSAQWPALRESYLDWLTEHEKQGHHYERGEEDAAAALGPVTLQGRIDRIDRIDSAPGQPPRRLLLDYKTESLDRTRGRVKDAEDIQLPFYAALLPDDEVQAAYLSVSERAPVQTVDQRSLTALRDALVEGVSHDMRAIAAGAPLPALGEGSACTWCAARGLCRRDFWSEAPAPPRP